MKRESQLYVVGLVWFLFVFAGENWCFPLNKREIFPLSGNYSTSDKLDLEAVT